MKILACCACHRVVDVKEMYSVDACSERCQQSLTQPPYAEFLEWEAEYLADWSDASAHVQRHDAFKAGAFFAQRRKREEP
jgi:hypothetical protein